MNLVVNLAFYLSVLAAALAGLTMAAQLVVNLPMVGAALCLAPATWIWGGRWDFNVVQVAGFNVYFSDLVAVVLIVAALIQLDTIGDWAWPLGAITILCGLSLVQGMAIFGDATAVNEARGSVYLIAAAWWAVTVDWSQQDTGKAALVAGWFFVAIALVHLLLYGFTTVNNKIIEGSAEDASHRMLNSTQALLLALCAATVIFDRNRRGSAVMPVSAAVFTLVIIMAQNRSVWSALIGGFLTVFLLSPDSGRRRRAFVPLALAGLVAVLVFSGILGGSIGAKLAIAGTDTGTWNWRLMSWQQLLDSWLSAPPLSVAFGEPFGQGFARLINGYITAVSAHSWYVELLLRFGVVGTLLWVIIVVRAMARARKANMAALFFGAALLCYSAVYVLPWNVAPWLGILLTVQGSVPLMGGTVEGECRRPSRPQPVQARSATARRVR